MRFELICVPVVLAILISAASAQPADLKHALMNAVAIDDAALVSRLIRQGVDFQAVGTNGLTPLAVAASLDEADIATILVDMGAQPVLPDRASSPLAIAVAMGNSDVVGPLLSKGVTPTAFNDALNLAATKGDPFTIGELLKAAPLTSPDMDKLAATLKAKFGIDVQSKTLGPKAVLATLKLCKDAGLYSTAKCVSPDTVIHLPPVEKDVPPQDCDRLAALPDAPESPVAVEPVYKELLDYDKAMIACADAIQHFPSVARFYLERGRAELLKSNPDSVYDLRRAKDLGSRTALYELGVVYAGGVGYPADYKKSGQFFAQGAQAGDADAIAVLGMAYRDGAGVKADPTKAMMLFQTAAARGSGRAMEAIGDMNGKVPGFDIMAFDWYKKAVATGYRDAYTDLATAYAQGRGTTKDPVEALRLYRIGAAHGAPFATYRIGQQYANGEGVAKDVVLAREWFEKAAKLGNPKVMTDIGIAYHNGNGVPKDYAAAREFYEKAASKGYGDAMLYLGELYTSGGLGVDRDPATALEWYKKGADAGSAGATFNLAATYTEGPVKTRNYPAAIKLLEKSAALGQPEAFNGLGFLAEYGLGETKNIGLARSWYAKADALGNKKARAAIARLDGKR